MIESPTFALALAKPWTQAVAEFMAAVAVPSCAAREPGILAAAMVIAALVRAREGDAAQLAQLLERHLPGQLPQWRQVLTDDDLIAELERGETLLTMTTMSGCEAARDWKRVQQFGLRWSTTVTPLVPAMERSTLTCLVVTKLAFYNYALARILFDRLPVAESVKNLQEAKMACVIGKVTQALSESARLALADLHHGNRRTMVKPVLDEIIAHLNTLPPKNAARVLLRKQFPDLFAHLHNRNRKVIAWVLFTLSLGVVITLVVAIKLPPAMGLAVVVAIGFGLWRRSVR